MDLIERQKAIDALDGLCDRECEYSKKQRHVMCGACHLGSAFDVIEQLPPLQENLVNNSNHIVNYLANDTISRQAAIEVIDAVFPVDPMKSEYAQAIACGAALAKTYVEQLPSAQPEPCEDAVSRQAVKEWLAKWEGYIDADIIARMQYRIIDIPSAQPEPLDEWCTDCKEYDKDKHCCPRWNRVIRQTLKDMKEEQPEPHWIPCSERLPEERQEILATTTDNAWGDVVIIRTYYKEMHKSVIAWMPLPEPYAERRTDVDVES